MNIKEKFKEFFMANLKAIPKTILDVFMVFLYVFIAGFVLSNGGSFVSVLVIWFFAILGGNVIYQSQEDYRSRRL